MFNDIAWAMAPTQGQGAQGGGSTIMSFLPLILIVLPFIFWLWALIDILKNDFKGSNKIVWLLLVIFIPVLGFVLYFLIGKKQKIQPTSEAGK
jgi:preprotein translocase subunit YajC